jgi:hypothetical protein
MNHSSVMDDIQNAKKMQRRMQLLLLCAWLLTLTGQKVRDFNYYNARELERKIHFVQSENIQLSSVNRSLNEELDRLRSERSGHY